MSRTNLTPWQTEAAANVTENFQKPLITDYTVVTDVPGTCQIKNIKSDPNFQELVTYRYNSLDKVSTTLKKAYPQSSVDGYQFVIKDEYVNRTTNADNTINDDPVIAYLTVRTTNGANIITGNELLKIVQHLMGFVIDLDAEGAIAAQQITLDRIMRGAVKPAKLV